MPTISSGKVLVTGANGYIAIWVVKTLLEKGYAVRGTVRSEEKGKYLKEYFKGYGDKLELVVVPDITKEGAFDDAVKGVDAIEHTASPFHEKADDPKEIIDPAVRGTVGILESALKNGQQIKRIVITSSCASVMHPPPKPTTFSEKDWNSLSLKEVEEKGRDAPAIVKYRASKILAEKAAWDFHKEHKDEVKWDITVINPPFVFGPPIHQIDSPTSLNTSLQGWYNNVFLDIPRTKETLSYSSGCVDVRDVAKAHVLSLEKEAAGGERIITSEGSFTWQEWIDIANSLQPPPFPSHKLPHGFPELERVYNIEYETKKSDKIFGIKYLSKEVTTKDTLLDFAKRGW